jgi:hypothetical protein
MKMNEKLKAGYHDAKPTSWGILEGKKAPQVFVKFDLGVTWFGSFAEGRAREITLEALVVMGYQADELTALVNDPNALDKGKTVSLKIGYDPLKVDKQGEMRPVVEFVNEPGGGMKNALGEGDALKALMGLKVKGDLMKIRKDKGVENAPKREFVPEGANPTTEEIPF